MRVREIKGRTEKKKQTKRTTYLPCVKKHVESESPQLEPLIRPVNEYTVDRHRTRRIHPAHRHRVIREETQLQNKKNGLKLSELHCSSL